MSDVAPELNALLQTAWARLLGLELLEAQVGEVTVRLPYRPEFARGTESFTSATDAQWAVNGSVVSAVMDLVAGMAVRSTAGGQPQATIELHVHYLAPAQGDLRFTARVVRRGRTIAVLDLETHDSTDTRVAIGRATFFIRPPAAS